MLIHFNPSSLSLQAQLQQLPVDLNSVQTFYSHSNMISLVHIGEDADELNMAAV